MEKFEPSGLSEK